MIEFLIPAIGGMFLAGAAISLYRFVAGPVVAPGEFLIPVRMIEERRRNDRVDGSVIGFDEHGRAIRTVYDRRPGERLRAESCGQTVPFLGRTPEEAAANLWKKLGNCPHGLAEEVTLCTGEVVGAVCPTCWEALPAAFVGSAWRP